MNPVNKCPYRSPVAISDAISELIRGKVVCELGCAEGDNMEFMARYAQRVFGIEFHKHRYRHARARGFEIIVGDYTNMDIPLADVYYFWPDDGSGDNPVLVRKILANQEFKGTIIVAADLGYPPEVPSVRKCAELGTLMEVPFNEGSGHRQSGTFILAVIEAEEARKRLDAW